MIKTIRCNHQFIASEYVAMMTQSETKFNNQRYKLKSIICAKCGKLKEI